MITQLIVIAVVCAAVLAPCLAIGRFLEWRAWDNARRVDRLRARREAA